MKKKTLEESLLTKLNTKMKSLKKDEQLRPKQINDVIAEIMKDVDKFVKENKTWFNSLSNEDRLELINPNRLLNRLIREYYTKSQIDTAVNNNLRRAIGNLAEQVKKEELYKTLKEFNYSCPYSDTLLLYGSKINLDHIIPISLGGPTDDWNIIPICDSCNSSKNDKHLLEWWDRTHPKEDEYRLVKIYEYMITKLLDDVKNNNYKITTTFSNNTTNNDNQNSDSKLQRLDPITFLYQLLKHIENNKEYIVPVYELDYSAEDKYKELVKLFEQLIKLNKKKNHIKTDLEILSEREELVKEIKSYGIIDYYYVAFNYYSEIIDMKKTMRAQNKTEEEISSSVKNYCENLDRSFNFNQFYRELMIYRDKLKAEGKDITRLNVPIDVYNEETGYNLGQFVSKIRTSKKKLDAGKKTHGYVLTAEQYKMLDDIGFVWDAGFDFDRFLYELKIYRKKLEAKGEDITRLNVPKDAYNEETGYNLGQFVSKIRVSKKQLDAGKKPKGYVLTAEQYKMLDDIGFVWDADIKFDFDRFLDELKIYRKKLEAKGEDITRLNVDTRAYNEETKYNLGQFVNGIRKSKKKLDAGKKPKAYVLTAEQYKKLDDIGFVWDAGFDFDKFYKELMIYRAKLEAEHKDITRLNVSTSAYNEETGYKLGYFVSCIRMSKKKLDAGKKTNGYVLTAEQYKELDKIGFVWDADIKFDFDRFLDELMIYRAKLEAEGKDIIRLNVRTDAYNEETKYNLGQFVSCIRRSKKKLDAGKKPTGYVLTAEQYKKLDDIGFVWDASKKSKKVDDATNLSF